jgi:hypothetical protein
MLEEHAPARIGRCRTAAASAVVEIRAASDAKSLAVFPTLYVRGRGKQPGLSHCRAQIDIPLAGVEEKDVRIVCLLGAVLREDEVYFFIHLCVYIFEAKATRHGEPALDSTAEVEPSTASRRQPPREANRLVRMNVAFFPHRVVGRKGAIDMDGFGLQGPEVEGQHKPFNLASLRGLFQ